MTTKDTTVTGPRCSPETTTDQEIPVSQNADGPHGASGGSTAQSTVTALDGVLSPDLEDYVTGRICVPTCVLCAPGPCGCAGAR
jgi:hypothetical protein